MRTFGINFVVSMLLCVGGFLVPPVGVIDGSVLTAVGLLLMFSVVEMIPDAIRAGRGIRLQRGDSSVEILSGQPPSGQ